MTKLTSFSASVRTAMLNEYPTDELFQIYAVVRFFRGILAGVWDEEHDHREFFL